MSKYSDAVDAINLETDYDVRSANLESLRYIKFLSEKLNISLSNFNILEDFRGQNLVLLPRKNDIGKIFMDKLDKQKITTRKLQPDMLLELKQKALNISQTKFIKLQDEYEDRIGYYFRKIKGLEDEIENSRTKKNNFENMLADVKSNLAKYIEEDSNSLISDIQDVLKLGYWTNPKIDREYLWLNTKHDIIMSYSNKKTNVEYSICLGQFAVRINLRTFDLLLTPYAKNLHSGDFVHPHFDIDGEICWGSSEPKFEELKKKKDLKGLLNLAYSLLQEYNESSPYVTLISFKDSGKRYARRIKDRYPIHPNKRK